jgi:hypothetical protein
MPGGAVRLVALAGLAAVLAACASNPAPAGVAVYDPPPGINQVLAGPIAAAPGHSLILGDLNMAPAAEIPRHYHHGEEYIYVLGGSATVRQPPLTRGRSPMKVMP